ncbi:unnamed protein product [Leuciscus chuanchicus]
MSPDSSALICRIKPCRSNKQDKWPNRPVRCWRRDTELLTAGDNQSTITPASPVHLRPRLVTDDDPANRLKERPLGCGSACSAVLYVVNARVKVVPCSADESVSALRTPSELENDWQRKYECCLFNDAHQSGQSACSSC